MEVIDNNNRKNNIRIKNLKEDVEGQDLEEYLQDFRVYWGQRIWWI